MNAAFEKLGIDEKKLESLDNYIIKHYETSRPTTSSIAIQDHFFAEFNDFIRSKQTTEFLKQRNCEAVDVLPFGSRMTHLATDNSDFDVCVSLKMIDDKGERCITLPTLTYIYNNFCLTDEWKTKLSNLTFIKTAKVPIITGKLGTISIDISVQVGPNPPPSYLATYMINGCCQHDPRIAPLCVFFKKWTRSMYNNGGIWPETSIPNSYATTLLILHVMQLYGIVPNVCISYFEKFDPTIVKWVDLKNVDIKYPMTKNELDRFNRIKVKNNECSLAVIAIVVLDYFANLDNLENMVIDVKTGEYSKRSKVTELKETGLVIRDPYDRLNPARRVKNLTRFQNIFRVLLAKIQHFDGDTNIEGIFLKHSLDEKLDENGHPIPYLAPLPPKISAEFLQKPFELNNRYL